MMNININQALKDVSETIPNIMDNIQERLEWIAIQLEDYRDGELNVSEDYIHSCDIIIDEVKDRLNVVLKTLNKRIYYLSD